MRAWWGAVNLAGTQTASRPEPTVRGPLPFEVRHLLVLDLERSGDHQFFHGRKAVPSPVDPRPHPPVALVDLDGYAVPLRDAPQPPAENSCPAHVDALHRTQRPAAPSGVRLRDRQDPPHV